jgi:hypothetical protein
MKEKLLKVAVESIDLKKLANGIIDEVIEEALKKVVADSENTFDDMAMGALWPVLEKEVKELIEEKLDMGKLLGLQE